MRPTLRLLGDIGYAVEHEAEHHAFLRRQLRLFRVVFLVRSWGIVSLGVRIGIAHGARTRDIRRERGQCEVGARAGGEGGATARGGFDLLDRTRFDFPTLGLESGWLVGWLVFLTLGESYALRPP
ncbi:hypothetical protein F5B21DRAFT_490978 [Xylaria acuta]|nr:hypothetical protein F5B21DRAFT_490978 [Xylaria acuta]